MSDPLNPSLPPATVADAREAYERYLFALEHGLLVQSDWHTEQDGRKLACMLGVLGQGVASSDDCPAQVMPRWLARMVPGIFDGLGFEDAKAWGLKFYAELARLNGQVPFSVIYDWQASCVLQFWKESLQKRRFSPEVAAELVADVDALIALHQKHLAGGAAPKADWHEALRKVYCRLRYAAAYAYADAYADAAAYAYADADADADAAAYAADAAAAYGVGGVNDWRSYLYAEPPAPNPGETKEQMRGRLRAETRKLLADGLVEAMSRAQPPAAEPGA